MANTLEESLKRSIRHSKKVTPIEPDDQDEEADVADETPAVVESPAEPEVVTVLPEGNVLLLNGPYALSEGRDYVSITDKHGNDVCICCYQGRIRVGRKDDLQAKTYAKLVLQVLNREYEKAK